MRESLWPVKTFTCSLVKPCSSKRETPSRRKSFSLGRANIEGTGVSVNFEKAKEYFKSSCNQGYEPGCQVYQKMSL